MEYPLSGGIVNEYKECGNMEQVLINKQLIYVYEKYLCKEYSVFGGDDREYEHQNWIIYRPNHGLVHTLRCTAYVPFVGKAYNATRVQKQQQQISNLDIECLRKLQCYFMLVEAKIISISQRWNSYCKVKQNVEKADSNR